MANRFRERQAELEPSRVQYAIEQLTGLGYEVERLTGLGEIADQHNTRILRFTHKGSPVLFYPYTGWHTGKTIKDGRGIHKLLKQLQR